MKFFYPLFIASYGLLIKVAGLFNNKAKLFVSGRKNTFKHLKQWRKETSKEVIWFHAASLGEFEQGRPLIEYLKKEHPQFAILITFFSPSGYEVRKKYEHANHICYLPLDSSSNSKRFISLVQPKMTFFIKYEFWNNYFEALKKKGIPIFSISSIFRENQVYFKSTFNFHNTILRKVEHFFVQNKTSVTLLKQIEISNVSISGDTRFDRVADITKSAQPLEIIENFIGDLPTVILGSSWKDDLDVIGSVLNKHIKKFNLIIAPHNVDAKTIDEIDSYFTVKVLRYSDYELCCDGGFSVLTIDNIGLLTSIYAYSDIAYVGGAFRTGLHNILEPATFGSPVIFGPNYAKFDEATNLIQSGGGKSINTTEEFENELLRLLNPSERTESGAKSKTFIQENTGATKKIVDYLENKNLL